MLTKNWQLRRLHQSLKTQVEELLDEASAEETGVDEGDLKKTVRRVDEAETGKVRPSYYWTWRLMSEGYSLEEVMQVRQIDTETIAEHLIQASENSLQSEANWLLTDSQLIRLRAFIAENSSIDRTTLISRLPKSITAKQLLYVLQVERGALSH